MVVTSRHLACAAVAVVAALSAGADQCGGGGGTPPACDEVNFDMPVGFGQWIPGGPAVTIQWTLPARHAVDVELVDGDARHELGAVSADAASSFAFTGTDAAGAPIPPGNYQIAITPDCASAPVASGPLTLVVVQGLVFHDAALSFTGAQPEAMRQIVLTSVTRSPITVDLLADDLVFAQVTIPGELERVVRSYPFTGMTTTAASIPAGHYTIHARVTAGNLGYTVDGPTLDWQP